MADKTVSRTPAAGEQAPWPGSHEMPRWQVGELIDAPRFTWKNWFALLGPGLLMGGSAIGGGEWLAGPAVTAQYGGALMWLATLSIVGQVFYNIEVSRYALYTGEPIFTGKFRTLPGPLFWLTMYLVLDFGSVFPYLAANAATPLAAVILGHMPDPSLDTTFHLLGFTVVLKDTTVLRSLGYAIYLAAMIPLIFGGKIYNTLKWVMSFKIVMVLGFLLFLAICFSTRSTWREIGLGFFKFGTVPIKSADASTPLELTAKPDEARVQTPANLPQTENIFVSLWNTGRLPNIDFSTIVLLGSFAAIAGSGGLSNAPVSNYTRDQGWGMGYHVGAIPSMVGAQNIELSHVGMIFHVTKEALARWRRWVRHVVRDQVVVWMPACFLGMALPSMLSVQFLPRGVKFDDWVAAGMTAHGVGEHVGAAWGAGAGSAAWYMTLFCGFLVLGPTMAVSADGVIRRWVDVLWTSSARLRAWDPRHIRHVYFAVLIGYASFGLLMLSMNKPLGLLKIASLFYNFALGFSCFHTLVINHLLLPRELRPGWFARTGLALAGVFFMGLSLISTANFLWPSQ